MAAKILHDADVRGMSPKDLTGEVLRLRLGIREHRDQKGDDRCWLDDSLLHGLLPDSPPRLTTLPPWDIMEQNCTRYFKNRQCARCPHDVSPDAVMDPGEWDADLETMGEAELREEALRLRAAIRLHRDIPEEKRTATDDEVLYGVLPEKLPADTRLTGSAFLPSCRRFWETRQEKHPQKLHEW